MISTVAMVCFRFYAAVFRVFFIIQLLDETAGYAIRAFVVDFVLSVTTCLFDWIDLTSP
jgi:hypothetical protein